MADGFIKLYKKMLKWEWYDDINTKVVFLHCLLRANWESGSWHGINYDAGQFITSLSNLARETCLTIPQVRTALKHLQMTDEIANESHANFRVITIKKWDAYQGDSRQRVRQKADISQTDSKRIAIDKEIKEIKRKEDIKDKKNIYGEYRHVRLTDKERDRLFNDFGESETLAAIKFLDEYKQRKGYKCKDDNLTLRKWVFDAVKEERSGNSNKTTQTQTQSLAEKWGL